MSASYPVWRRVVRPFGARATARCASSLSYRFTVAGRYDEAVELARVGLEVLGRRQAGHRDLLVAVALQARVAFAAVLGGRHEEAASACRSALEALENAGAVRDAERTLREIANAWHPRLDVTVTSRTNRATATCEAPNCAGHRLRA